MARVCSFEKISLAVLALCLVATPSCAQNTAQRVASINVCTDEYVFRLVPASRIAALSFLAGDTHPVVSTIVDQVDGIVLIAQSAEAVLAVQPDLVVIDQGTRPRVRAILRQAGIAIVDVPWANSLDEIRAVTRALSASLGVPERGEALIAEMDAQLARVRSRAPHPPVRTLLYHPNGYTVSGGIADAIMNAAGLENIAPSLNPTRAGTLPVEMVIARAPQLLIVNGDEGGGDSRARLMLSHPALTASHLSMRKEWLALTPLLCPGPWSVLVAEDFVQAGRLAAASLPD
ncbi:MAG: ABC transporter substrate-binding protein [Proteobacteria bacterium]|nr:ABC transporter substrate-binding protein [Pseudomonadota bacterium]